MLKTLDTYIELEPQRADALGSLWSRVTRDHRFALLITLSVVIHLVFYAVIIKLDSLAMLRAIANRRSRPQVTMIELVPPSDRPLLRTAPESLERADLSRLQFDPS